jgi:hypothetical protein
MPCSSSCRLAGTPRGQSAGNLEAEFQFGANSQYGVTGADALIVG